MQTLESRSQRITVEKNVNTSQTSMQTVSPSLAHSKQRESESWELAEESSMAGLECVSEDSSGVAIIYIIIT